MPSFPLSTGFGVFPFEASLESTQAGPGQYDGLSAEYYFDQQNGLGFAQGGVFPGYSKIFVDQLRIRRVDADVFKASASCVGLLNPGASKRLRRVSAFGQEVSVGPITYEGSEIVGIDTDGDGEPDATARELVEALRSISTPSGTGTRWIIDEPMLAVVDRYFQTELPDTTLIGNAVSPVSPPPPPAYIWGGYQDAMRFHHPNGWVLESRDYEAPYPGLYLVTDTFAYKQLARPD